jgi:LuxR family maltose regulon positive regulatory protein
LFNANLFLIPLDDEGQWYRYHHLFADLLRDLQNALQKDDTAELHRRAGQWYAPAGMASEAIQHALAAEAYGLAVDLLERHAMGMIMQGYAKTVNGWVEAIPAEWAWSSPRTHLAFALMHLLRGAYTQAAPYLERLEGVFSGSQVSEEESEALKAEWLVMQSLLLNMQGKTTESLALATQALEIAPEQDSRVRSLAYFGQACAYQVMEEYGPVVDAYRMAIQHGRAAETLITEMMSTSSLAQLAFEHGQLHLAFEIAKPVSARLDGSGSLPPISTVVYGMLGEIHYQWLQIDQARRNSLRALQLTVLGGYNSGMINYRVLLSRVAQLAGDLKDAAREIQQAVDLMQVDTPDYVRQEAVAQQVRVYLARNRPAAAELALQGQGFSFQGRFSSPALSPDQRIRHSVGLLYNSSLRVLLYRARAGRDLANLRTGIELASRLITGALQGQTLLVALEALLLRAQMHAVLGSTGASQADYARALELAEPEGILGIFVEQGFPVAEALSSMVKQGKLGAVQARCIQRILAAFSSLQPTGATRSEQFAPDLPAGIEPVALIEPLTDRELDVLRLMAEGLKYKEIAERLFISLNNVGSQPTLHSRGRRQAMNPSNSCLVLSGVASFLILSLHLALALRPQWYRHFGADELAQMHEQGSRFTVLATLGLALMFAVWGIYALSGAGVIGQIPLLRAVLVAIGVIHVLRSLMLPSELVKVLLRGYPLRFAVLSTGSLAAGLLHLIGTVARSGI